MMDEWHQLWEIVWQAVGVAYQNDCRPRPLETANEVALRHAARDNRCDRPWDCSCPECVEARKALADRQ